MTFDEYQKQALKTAYIDPAHKDTLMDKTIWAMGVAGEAGEVVEKWKKMVAYNKGEITDEFIADMKKELGDIVWYVAVLANSLGLSFEEVIELNVKKLQDRQKRNVIRGVGDNR
jgi:NTP pyrophosphatase (non-canonical NTP hydrolase)